MYFRLTFFKLKLEHAFHSLSVIHFLSDEVKESGKQGEFNWEWDWVLFSGVALLLHAEWDVMEAWFHLNVKNLKM